MITLSFRRGVKTTQSKKYYDCLCTCSRSSLTVKLALEITSNVSEASVVDTLRTADTNNIFGELAVRSSSMKRTLVTHKVQSCNLLEKLQQHLLCMMVWLNSIRIVSSWIFSYHDSDWWCFKIIQLQDFVRFYNIFFKLDPLLRFNSLG